MVENPFLDVMDKPLAAIKGPRGGYLQLASATATPTYSEMPESLLLAARAWAIILEELGSPRVYWITLSEVLTHLHIHLYPRWAEDTLKGVPLFEARDTSPQPGWNDALNQALTDWAETYQVHIIENK